MVHYDQKCCVFCLDYFEVYNKTENNQTYLDICKSKLSKFDNQIIKLNCNHIFHFKCFIEYLTYEYKTYRKRSDISVITFYNILNCPICRTNLLKNTIYKILDKSNNLYKIHSEITNKLKQLKYKMFYNTFLIYSKFIFNKHCQIQKVHDITKMNIMYDEILLLKKYLDKYILDIYVLKINLKS